MRGGKRVGCIIPALNEEQAIANVVASVPAWVDAVIVADNGSTDATASVARTAGAVVVDAPQRGYGAACLAGLAALPAVDVVVFVDGDFSDHPEDMHILVDPIVAGRAELVIGSRTLGKAEAGSLTPQQRFGNRLATSLVRLIWRTQYSDLGPFRAIRADVLRRLSVADPTFGWTIEMQIKAARAGIAIMERPARYRRRIGQSKISGTLMGTVRAGQKILAIIAREAVSPK